jgi:SNF2 family DNA or RNA helicase
LGRGARPRAAHAARSLFNPHPPPPLTAPPRPARPQTIAFLCHLRSKGIYGPYLILGPLSTLPNWVAEFARWAPDFPCLLYHGSKAERAEMQRSRLSGTVGKAFPAVVTSYEIAIADIKFLAKFTAWKYVVVDEGHRLKNMNCRLIRELRTLRADNKLLLTGTPLQASSEARLSSAACLALARVSLAAAAAER